MLGRGSLSLLSQRGSVFNPLAPAATVAPAVTPTTGGVGTVYTVSNGTWTNTPTFTYRWYNASGLIAGQTTNTYTTVAGDRGGSIYAIVTATSGAFTGTASSNSVAIPPVATSAPVNTALPSIAGTAQAGQTLIGSDGTYSGAPTPTLSRQWNRSGAAVGGATGTSYLLSAGDVGLTVTFVVTATNSAGSVSATSAPTAAVIAASTAVALAANPGSGTSFGPYNGVRAPGPYLDTTSATQQYAQATLGGSAPWEFRVAGASDNSAVYLRSPSGSTNFDMGTVTASGVFNPFAGQSNIILSTNTLGDILRVDLLPDGTIHFKKNGTEIPILTNSPTFSDAAYLAQKALNGTYAGAGMYASYSDPDMQNVLIGSIPTPLRILSTIYNTDTHNFDAVIAYTSASVPTYEISRNGGAYQDIPAYATTGAGNATLRLPAADVGMNGRATYTLRQKNLTSSTATGVYDIPEKMILGLNVGPESINELGNTARWVDPASYNNGVGRLGDYTVAPNIRASTDGAGATIKRDTFGKMYATNGVGLTNYLCLNDTTLCSPGTWNFAFAAGVVVTTNGNMTAGQTTGYVYNSATGLGSFTVPAGSGTPFNLTISAASIPVGGTGLSLTKQGAAGQFDANAVSAVSAIASELRFLDAAGVNNANQNNRTPLLMASRSFASRLRVGEWDVETQVALANACGCGMVYQTKHIDTDDLVSGAADYIAANLVGQARFSLSNEIWNFMFGQTMDVPLMGIRLGMALGSATPGTLVAEPNTFDSAQTGIVRNQDPTFTRGDWSGTVFTENDYGGAYAQLLVAIPINGQICINYGGPTVWNTATAQAIGCIFNMATGVAVSGSTGNFTLKYNSTDTTNAGLRWMSYRMKQIITIVNARFAAAGKPNPKYIFEGQAAGGFAAVKPGFDWDNLYLLMAGSHVSPAFYYGNGTAGDTLGVFNGGNYSEWTNTTGKNALYDTVTNPTLAARIAAAKTAYFSASSKTVTATVNAARSFRDALITYNTGKAGGLANDIRMGEYEFNWHTIFDQWPDQRASAYVAANTYVAGNVVRQAGSGLFKATQAVPINTPPPNATYWVSMASEADFTPNEPSQQLFSSIVLDSRHGTDIGNLVNGLRNVHGGPSYFYAFLGPNISSSNYFGLVQSYTDTTAANYRYSAVKAAKTAIG